MGLRCSGTNFIEKLINLNFPDYYFHSTQGKAPMPHKHHWPCINENSDYPFFKNKRCLFILVVRNPYHWLQSIFAHDKLLAYHDRSSFTKFLSSKFEYRKHLTFCKTKCTFTNILQAREHELNNFLEIGHLVDNFLFISYEKVAKKPEAFIKYISSYFQLKKSEIFHPILSYKGANRVPYQIKKYKPIQIKT